MAFTKVVGAGIHTESNINSHNINSTGIVTAIGLDVSGNATIGGVLTYEDVTSIDSVGLITARNGIQVTSGNIGIGTNSPQEELHILNTNPSIRLHHDNGNNIFSQILQNGPNLKIRLRNGSSNGGMHVQGNTGTDVTTFVRVTNSGNVGIGTDIPSYKLDVRADHFTKAVFKGTGSNSNNIPFYIMSGNSATQIGNHPTAQEETIIFNSSSNYLAFETADTERLRITGVGNVGIGTDNPHQKLHISATNPIIKFTDIDDNQSSMIRGASGHLYLDTDNTNRDIIFRGGDSSTYEVARITGDGNVGIGTQSPQAKLEVYTDDTLIGGIVQIIQDGTGDASIDFQLKGTREYTLGIDNSDSDKFKLSGSAGLGSNDLLTVTSSGRLGLGLVSPQAVMHVEGGSEGNLLQLSNTHTGATTSDGFVMGINSSLTYLYNRENKHLTFGTYNTERLRITSGGNLKLPDNAKIELGGAQTGAGDLEIYYNGTDGFINQKNNALKIQHNGSLKSYFGSNTLNLQDNYKLGLGTANDLQIYHTTSGTSWIRHTNSSEYFILEGNQLDFRDYATGVYRARMGTAVQLYYNGNNVKLSTTNTGITVTGEVATSQDYPNIRPTLDLNFAAEKKLDPRITYRRTGSASFTDEFGKVVIVGDNAPRFDHDPTTRECKGLLLEESRTNLLSYSIPDSSWQVSQATITENAGIAPDGTNTAVLHSDNNTSNQHLLYTTATVSSGTNYVVTSYLKQPSSNSRRYYSLTIHGLGYIIFDIQNGTVHNSSGTGIQGASITAVDNGWYRVKAHYITNNTNGNIYWLPIGDDGTSVVYTGASTAQGMLIWGCQLEASTFETSYIPTFGSTATRGKDLAEIDGEDFTDFFNQTEGTINCAYWLGNDNSGMRVFQINDSNNSVIDIVAGSGSGSGGYGYVSTGGVAQANGGQSTTNANYLNKLHVVTLAYKENDIAGINKNTGVLTTDTSATLDGAYNQVTFYQEANGADQLNGHLQRVQYYPKRLPNNQLKNLNNQ